MTTFEDDKKAFFKNAQTVYTNDRPTEEYEMAAIAASLNENLPLNILDAWKRFFAQAGLSNVYGRQMDDLWMEYLQTQGYTQPNLIDRLQAWYTSGSFGGLWTDAFASAFYLPSEYNSAYDCIPNKTNNTGDRLFGANLFPTLARVYGGVGYFPGTAGNYCSTPDSVALTFTNTLDIKMRLSLTDWTPASTQIVIAKNTNTGNQRTFAIGILSGGAVFMSASSDGITDGFNYTISDPLGATDGSAIWLRITYNVSGGNTTTNVYTAADSATVPTSWTLNKNQVNPVSVSLFDSTAPLEIGSYRLGTSNNMNGRVWYASVAATIDGTPVSVFDPSSAPNYAYGWRASTGEEWTVIPFTGYNSASIYKTGPAQLGSTGVSTNARIYGGVSYHPGTPSNSNFWTTPHTASYTGDTDNIAYIEPTDWTPSGYQIIAAKRPSVSVMENQLFIDTSSTGRLAFAWSSAGTGKSAQCTVATGFVDGTGAWVRATATQNGANRDIRFYTSRQHWSTPIDDIVWTQLGSTVSVASASTEANTSQTYIGHDNSGNVFSGVIRRYVLRSSIGGPIVIDFNPATATDLATSFTSSDGRVYTVTKTTTSDSNDPLRVSFSGERFALFSGTASNSISTPDSAVISVTGDIDLRARIQLANYATPSAGGLVSKWTSSASGRSYYFGVESNGVLRLFISTTGSDFPTVASSVALSTAFTSNQIGWVRVTRVQSSGLVTFFTSTDGTNWTQLGTTGTISAGSAIFDSATSVLLGASEAGAANLLVGNLYAAQIYNGINGTLVGNFDASLCGQTGYTDSVNSTVWTVNRSSAGRKTAIVDRTLFLLGTDDYIEMANHPSVDFGATNSFTIVVAHRRFGVPPAATAMLMRKSAGGARWSLSVSNTNNNGAFINDGTTSVSVDVASPTAAAQLGSMIRNVVTDTLGSAINSSITTTTDTTTSSLSNASVIRIGANTTSLIDIFEGEILGIAIFRRALTADELTRLRIQLNAAA